MYCLLRRFISSPFKRESRITGKNGRCRRGAGVRFLGVILRLQQTDEDRSLTVTDFQQDPDYPDILA